VKLIDRYILKELFLPFSISLLVLLFVLLVNYLLRTMDLLINRGVDLLSIGELLLFLLPSFLVISLPMAVLIGAIVAFARLTTDNETIVLQANGIGFFRWLMPVGMFSIGIYLLTLFLSFVAQPWGGQSMQNLTITMLRKQISLGLQPGIFNDLLQNMVLYVNEIPTPTKLKGILLFDFRHPEEPHLIVAEEGSILDDPNSDLIGFRFNHGSLHYKTRDQESYGRILFSTYEFTLDLGPLINNRGGQAGETSSPQELRERITASEGQDLQAIQLLEEHYKNYSFPTSCIFFGLIGVPLGMYSKRSGRLGGFAVGLVMMLGYYLLSALGDVSASARILPPVWAAWFPNLTLGIITMGLLVSASGIVSVRRFVRAFGDQDPNTTGSPPQDDHA
jgi:lipopolysaccharide export system permease protein